MFLFLVLYQFLETVNLYKIIHDINSKKNIKLKTVFDKKTNIETVVILFKAKKKSILKFIFARESENNSVITKMFIANNKNITYILKLFIIKWSQKNKLYSSL